MNKHKRLEGVLKWSFPDFPPRDKQTVLYSLMSYKGDLYFVNDSKEVLKHVSSSLFSFMTVDDDDVLTTTDNIGFSYDNVLSNEAVKIESYDPEVDCDYMSGLNLYVESNTFGKLEIRPRSFTKGGIKPQVLMYEDGLTPRHVGLEKL